MNGERVEHEQERGGGLAPSPRTLEVMRLNQQRAASALTKTPPVFDSAPAAVVALRETIKAIHFDFYRRMIETIDVLAQTERQGEVLHRRGMDLLHEHLAAIDAAIRSILIKGEVPIELLEAVERTRKGTKENDNAVANAGATTDART